jgi:hypothetical protein
MPQPKTDELKPGVSTTGMIRDGSTEGPATVRFDSVRKQNFHLNGKGEAVFHEKPDGYRFDDDGVLRPMKGTEEGESAAVIVDPHAGMPVEKEG